MALSDKQFEDDDNGYVGFYTEDVKQFIKDLKKYGREQDSSRFDYEAFERDIDKLAGDKLI